MPISTAAPGRRRWLLFIHQLPSQPSNLRVTTWRRLQQIGAIALKQAVYALPDTPEGREDFEWLKTEVKAAGGDATVFAADTVDAWSEDALVEEFRRARQDLYAALAQDVARALNRAAARGARVPFGRRTLAARISACSTFRPSSSYKSCRARLNSSSRASSDQASTLSAANTLASPPRGLHFGLEPLEVLTRIRRIGKRVHTACFNGIAPICWSRRQVVTLRFEG